jgi:hypothetical protein
MGDINRYRYQFHLLFVLFISGCATHHPATTPPITAEDVEKRGVIGVLGEPIGKVVVIYGRTLKNGADYDKGDGVFVRVAAVDDRVLPAPISIRILAREDARTEIVPPLNADVSLTGFETCYYTGIPNTLNYGGVQSTGYFLVSEFVLMDVQSPDLTATRPGISPSKPDAISIVDVSRQTVVGKLGKPFATPVEISGEIAGKVEDTGFFSWRIKAFVDRVDKAPLKHPVTIDVCGLWDSPAHEANEVSRQLQIGSGSDSPRPRERFTVLGYESGGYDGTPVAAASYFNARPADGLHFVTWFETGPMHTR